MPGGEHGFAMLVRSSSTEGAGAPLTPALIAAASDSSRMSRRSRDADCSTEHRSIAFGDYRRHRAMLRESNPPISAAGRGPPRSANMFGVRCVLRAGEPGFSPRLPEPFEPIGRPHREERLGSRHGAPLVDSFVPRGRLRRSCRRSYSRPFELRLWAALQGGCYRLQPARRLDVLAESASSGRLQLVAIRCQHFVKGVGGGEHHFRQSAPHFPASSGVRTSSSS